MNFREIVESACGGHILTLDLQLPYRPCTGQPSLSVLTHKHELPCDLKRVHKRDLPAQ